jgi:hypothetical protein
VIAITGWHACCDTEPVRRYGPGARRMAACGKNLKRHRGINPMNDQGTQGGVTQATGTTSGGAAAGIVKDEVQRLASEARTGTARVATQARDQAGELVNRTKDQTAQRLASLASALRQAGQQLEGEDAAGFGRYAGLAADQVEKASGYLSGKDLGELVRETQTFARRHPDLFLGGAFIAGVMGARFIKSSAPQLEANPEPFNAPHFSGTGEL